MMASSLSLQFAVTITLSLSSSSSTPSQVASSLLSLLGPKQSAATVPPTLARQLRSCLRFLVPPPPHPSLLSPTSTNTANSIWWPPAPVMDLARIAVDSGGDPGAIHRTLDPTMFMIPDVEGSKEARCQLTRNPYGRRFVSKVLNSYLAFLFDTIVARAPSIGMNVSLSRYDLFHGHLFLASGSGRLGILFHAKEYPEYDEEIFPYNTGYCQKGSNVVYDDAMNLRNILWLAPLPSNATKAWLSPGVLVALDAHPNGIIYKEMVPEYVDYVRTIYEDDFGDVVVDVNYLNVANTDGGERIFIC